MPIALLLYDSLAPLAGASTVLERWLTMLRLEAAVVARARSAFIVNWFGAGLRAIGGRVLVSIQNIDALTQQYRRARAASVAGDTGPNLAEPLAGLAGMGAGMVLSPTGAVLALYGALRFSLCSIGALLLTLIHGINAVQMGAGVGAVLLGIGLPLAVVLGIGYALYVALTNDEVVAKYETLGELTRLLQAFTGFIKLLTGPREAVRNPLLRSLLELADALAGLMAQLLGAAALLMARVLPRLGPLLSQLALLRDLGLSAIELLKAIALDAWKTLSSLWTGEDGKLPWLLQMLDTLLQHVEALLMQLLDGAMAVLAPMAQAMEDKATSVIADVQGHLGAVFDKAKSLILAMPLASTIRAGIAMAAALKAIFPSSASPTPAPAAAPSAGSSLATAAVGAGQALAKAWVDSRTGPAPPPPSMQTADLLVGLDRFGITLRSTPWGPGLASGAGAPFELDPATHAGVQQLLRSPASVFGGERARLREELGGKTPKQALESLRQQELGYRDLIANVVMRVLPPHIQAYLPALRQTFEGIDHYVYGLPAVDEEKAGDRFPVKDLPEDSGTLQPHVGKLILRHAGGDEVSLRNMAHDLRKVLVKQTYPAPTT